MNNGKYFTVTDLSKSLHISRAMIHYYMVRGSIIPDAILNNGIKLFNQDTYDRITYLYQQQQHKPRREKRKFE